MKEPLTEVTRAPEPEPVVPTSLPPPPANPNEAEKEEKRSNGAHTPVWADFANLASSETSAIGKGKRWWGAVFPFLVSRSQGWPKTNCVCGPFASLVNLMISGSLIIRNNFGKIADEIMNNFCQLWRLKIVNWPLLVASKSTVLKGLRHSDVFVKIKKSYIVFIWPWWLWG